MVAIVDEVGGAVPVVGVVAVGLVVGVVLGELEGLAGEFPHAASPRADAATATSDQWRKRVMCGTFPTARSRREGVEDRTKVAG
jgi:hypothetical protein